MDEREKTVQCNIFVGASAAIKILFTVEVKTTEVRELILHP